MARKRIAILIGGKGESGTRFATSMNDQGAHDYVLKQYSDVCISIQNGEMTVVFLDTMERLDDFDLIYFRGKSHGFLRHALAAYLKKCGIPMVNETESVQFQAMTKLEQYALLVSQGIPVPDSVFVGHPRHYRRVASLFENHFPLVAKSITGSNGNDNILIDTIESPELLTIPLPIFQPFIPNNFDYRCIVTKDTVALAYKRVRSVEKETYKNNVGQGGSREIVEPPEGVKHLAIQAARAVNRDLAGLDILPVNGGESYVVLEVNFNFGSPRFDDTDQEHEYYHHLDQYFSGLAT